MTSGGRPIGIRSTRQRSAISALLDESKGFRSAQDLHAELRERGDTIGLTTVYRTLQSMADAGAVDVLRTDSGELIFRKCSDSHHHHLVCRLCGFTVEVEEPGVEVWAHRAGRAHGFSDVSHTVELFGLCARCTEADAAGGPEAGAAAD
ncbi:Fur family transcriptional regulator [Dietzia sp. CH92]|uniref:Fur family transcriptional regulator n=1 Tax=Dietzia sp. CH92 TaxID=3051823 RepID=UPI0028D18E31|nr:Fur family transcriptional regulator [Dietzia sp. CH92]